MSGTAVGDPEHLTRHLRRLGPAGVNTGGMKAELVLQKALLLLDKGDMTRGLDELQRAIQLAEAEADISTRTTAQLVRGEVLIDLGRTSEARDLLMLVANLLPDASLDDLLDEEIDRARELLAGLPES